MVVVLRLGSELSLATATVFGVMLFKSIANGGEMSTHIILNLRNHHILITKITIRKNKCCSIRCSFIYILT
ncbi:MAG: hypothetical protein QG549_687 [Patescibacteria group bacterium]|nr:hypothetical protein [Patescibacteria group bacterium]